MKFKRFILFILILLFIQTSFLYFAFGTFLPTDLIGSFCFTIALSALLALIDGSLSKVGKWIVFVIILFLSIYSIVQLNFKDFMGNYISFVQGKDGITRIDEYIVQFILFIKARYYILLLAPLLSLIDFNDLEHNRKRTSLIYLTIFLIAFISSSFLIPKSNNIEKYLAQNGPIAFLFDDISNLFFNSDQEEEIIFNTPLPSDAPESDIKRDVDQDEWVRMMNEESDEDMLAIDNFLISQNISDYNDYTGIFKNKNVITIMIEAFDYMAIDEELTPTLYKMKTSGWLFDNYYTPKYSCTTGESEFIGLVSIIPENNTCAPNDYSDNYYPYSLFSLFDNEGYSTYAFHNWYDEFYDRRVVYENMGADVYYNKEDLDITEYKGWPSDIELIDQAYDIFSDSDHFYAHIVTSTTHFPYDQDSWSADLNIDRINEVHPDYPLEIKRYLSKAMILDEALEHLLTHLENGGKLDDTIILMYADHHPLNLDYDTIETYSYMDRTSYRYLIDHTPMIIYGGGITPNTYSDLMSTFDIVPTLANLCGIEFDPRFYMGNDYFAPNKETMTVFANGDFLVDEGYYSNIEEVFYPFDNEDISQESLEYLKILAKNKTNVSSKILKNNYFLYRDFTYNK